MPAHSLGFVTLTGIRREVLCGSCKLFVCYIEVMGKLSLQRRVNLAKERRHIARPAFRSIVVNNAISKRGRIQFFAVGRD